MEFEAEASTASLIGEYASANTGSFNEITRIDFPRLISHNRTVLSSPADITYATSVNMVNLKKVFQRRTLEVIE